MAFSRIETSYSGTNLFSINFTLGYLSQDHITARVNDEVDGLGDPLYRNITFITEGTVSIDGTLVNGDSVVFERTVPKDAPQHDFSDGAIIIESNLDENQLQAIMLAHEILDGRISTFITDLDMGNKKIINVADGTDDNDAVNYSQLVDMTGNAPAFAAQAAASATEASASETAAATSETNAAASEAAVLAAVSSLPSNNFTATTDPTVNDDSSATYLVGSRWVNVTTDEAFICVDATVGAAVWLASTLTLDELGTLAVRNSVTYDVVNAALLGNQTDIDNSETEKVPTCEAVKDAIDANTPTLSGTLIGRQVFTSSGTWTKPAGCNAVKVTVVGGGGGSSSGLGGTSSFGSHCSATGGGAGTGGAGGAGGIGSNGDLNIVGGSGEGGFSTPSDGSTNSKYALAGKGGDSMLGGGARGSGAYSRTSGSVTAAGAHASVGYGGGASGVYGGGGGGGASLKHITNGLGGSETVSIGNGGNGTYDGAAGVVIVEEYT